jgi:hypothetical protein
MAALIFKRNFFPPIKFFNSAYLTESSMKQDVRRPKPNYGKPVFIKLIHQHAGGTHSLVAIPMSAGKPHLY